MFVRLSKNGEVQLPTKFATRLDSSKDWNIGVTIADSIFISDTTIPHQEIFGIAKPRMVAGNYFVTLPGDLCKELNLKAGGKLSCRFLNTLCGNEILLEKL